MNAGTLDEEMNYRTTKHKKTEHVHCLWVLPVTPTPITEFWINRGFKHTAPVNIPVLMTFVTNTRTEHTS